MWLGECASWALSLLNSQEVTSGGTTSTHSGLPPTLSTWKRLPHLLLSRTSSLGHFGTLGGVDGVGGVMELGRVESVDGSGVGGSTS